MAAPRRVGAETSKTRAALMDAAERLMLDDGYAAVTYRTLARRAGVTPGLVQYYFPTIDDLFLSLLRRRSERNREKLVAALADRPGEVLRIVWEFSTDETSAALLMEFMALANHRKSIRAAIIDVIEGNRQRELEALRACWDEHAGRESGLTPEGLLFLVQGIPKMMLLEDAFGITSGHDEVRGIIERRLDELEPS